MRVPFDDNTWYVRGARQKVGQTPNRWELWGPWLILGALFLALSLGLGLLLYRELGSTLFNQWESALVSSAQDRAKGLQTYFEEERKQLNVIAHYPTLHTVLGQPPSGPPSYPAAEGPVLHLHKLLESASRYNDYLGIWVLDADGRPFLEEARGEALDPELLSWANHHESSLKFASFQSSPGLYFYQRVVVGGKPIGALLAAKRCAEVKNLIQDIQQEGESIEVLLARPEGDRLLSLFPSDKQLPALKPSDLSKNILRVPGAGSYLVASSPVGESPYLTVCLLDNEKLTSHRDRFWAAMALVATSLVAGMGLIAFGYHKQQRMVQDLRRLKAEARLGSLMTSAPDPILFLDSHERIQFHNPMAESVLRYPSEEFEGLTFSDIQAEGTCLAEIVQESSGPMQVTDLLTKSGERVPVELHSQELHSGGETSTLVVARDLTERLKAQAEIDHSKRCLSEAQKMEAVGRFAGGIAHDFNNLLTVIGGYAESVREIQGEEELAKELLHAVARAKELTGQLLTFSRKKPTKPKTFELSGLLEKNLAMVRRLLPADAKLDWEPGEGEFWVHLNPGQAEQLLLNLVINARDAVGGTGRVGVRLLKRTLALPLEWAGGELPPGDYNLLRVQDDGCGIDKETLHKIFEPFFTTKPMGQGTGLGLSTVFGILKNAGAGVVVESSPGEGARFDVYLPRETAPEPAIPQSEESGKEKGRPCRIALAEDEPALRKLLVRTLTRAGFEVDVAENGKAAVETFGPKASQYDLLITDIVMPGVRGPEVAKVMEASNPKIRVIFMSGYGGDSFRGMTNLKGRFLQKPFSPVKLVELIRTLPEELRSA